jgi:hypothetical protein
MSEQRIEKNRHPTALLDELAGETPDQQKRLDKLRPGIFGGQVEGHGANKPTLYLNADLSARKLDDPDAGRITSRSLGSNFGVIRRDGESGEVSIVE